MASGMDQRNSSVFASVVTHTTLMAFLFLLILRQPDEGNSKTETIQIDTMSEKKSSHRKSHTASKAPSTQVTRSSVRPHGVTLSDLGLKLNTEPLPPSSEEERTSAPEASNDDGWDVLNPDPRIARFNQYVYQTVQGWLDRDAHLNPYTLQGTVKVRIWFNEKGEYLENETVYEAVDEDFKRIVARALRKSFVNPIPRPFMYQNKKFYIDRVVVLRERQ